jgi:hypothetical protein
LCFGQTYFEHERDHGICATRRRVPSLESLACFPRASGANTHEAGETACCCIFAPGFGGGQAPLSQLAETNCAVFPLQHHFHPNMYSKMNMTSMRPVRQLIKYLTSATKSFGAYSRTGLELLGAGTRGVRAPKLGASALSFPRPFITSAACISRDFLTVKRSTLLHSKTCAFRFVILMDRNDSYKQLPGDCRWQGQTRFL